MKFEETTPVVIVGAGLGGLTFALACQKLGIPCTILEKQPSLSEIGAGITLWENAIKVMQELGALEAISAISRPSAGGKIATADGRTSDALLRYQKLRAQRTTRVTKMSRTIGQVAQLKNLILRALRDRAFRLIPERSRNAQLEWLACYDAASVPLH